MKTLVLTVKDETIKQKIRKVLNNKWRGRSIKIRTKNKIDIEGSGSC